jgi:hypothetical protein
MPSRPSPAALALGLRLCAFLGLLTAAALLPRQLPAGLNQPSQAIFRLAPPPLALPEIQIRLLFSSRESLRQDALKLTARTLAAHLKPELAAEDWDIQAIPLLWPEENQNQSQNQEKAPLVAVALSLPPEQGYLCLLETGGQGYTLAYAEKGLLPIGQLSLWPFAGDREEDLPPALIAIRESHDETVGAFSSVERFSLWLWHKNKLRRVFQVNTRWQLTFPYENTWVTARQQYEITGEGLSLEVRGAQEYAESETQPEALGSAGPLKPLPALSRQIHQRYTFFPGYLAFGMAEASWRPRPESSAIPVLLLQDLAQDLEAPFHGAGQEYLIKTSNDATALAPAAQLTVK